MSEKLLIAINGHRNSGKSTTWYNLFNKDVRTGKSVRRLNLNSAQYVDVFLINGSPEERDIDVEVLLPESLPQIVLCSTQYIENVTKTFEFFADKGYSIFVQWLNPGFNDDEKYDDELDLMKYLLDLGATIQLRNGKPDSTNDRVQEVREFILGWATHRDLVFTSFP